MKRLTPLVVLAAACLGASSPWLGTIGLSPTELDSTHELQLSLPAMYTKIGLDYQRWTNTGGTDYFDGVYSLNTNFTRVVGTFFDVPTNQIATFAPMIRDRYPLIWGFEPNNETTEISSDAARLAPVVRMFRAALPTNILIGPAYVNDQSDNWMSNMVALGVLTNLDVISMHDSFAVNYEYLPGPWDDTDFYGPYQTPAGGFYDLPGRLQWMQSFTNYLRTNYPAIPKTMVTEHYLYYSNSIFAWQTADVFVQNETVMFLAGAHYPSNLTNSRPDAHGLYSQSNTVAEWSPAIKAMIGHFDPGPRVGNAHILTP